MKRNFVLLGIICALTSSAVATELPKILCPPNATPLVRLAATEVQRYAYLRTGKELAIVEKKPESGRVIAFNVDKTLEPEAYRLLTVTKGGQTVQHIMGGSDVGVLYGAYRYAELLGVRFYLHGDTVPDERLKDLPAANDTGKPLFDTRGIQPFHDFQEGPDWWNQDDYLAYIAQLAKLRMNFFGLHCYPEGAPGAEPLVWIGTTNDIGPKGQVKFSYPTEWATTERGGMWGYVSTKTSDYSNGAGLLFPSDAYGPDVQAGMIPRPTTPEQYNELFNRVGKQMRSVFTEAKSLGIKTCIGTETPLTIPKMVSERSTDARALYTGMFKRIAMVCPVDYYWLWTPEYWTWSGNNPKQFQKTTSDIEAALAALKDLGNPFTLATCGWVLGPSFDRAALDEFLPKTSPMSCINREVGHAGVEPAFANVVGRPKWAIPWLENDPNLVGPQPWAARMRYDAVDARRFGCTGLLGIHWRTKAMAMNVAALAAAAWDQSWVPADFDTKPVKPSKGSEGALGGSVAAFTAPVTGTAVQEVYQKVRYDLNGYNLTVPDGTYTVTLQFNEPVYTAAGVRVFGAKIQGKQVIEHLDVFAKVGQNKALDLSFSDIAITNGTLNVAFTREVEFPCIAGIVITGKTKATNQLASQEFTRKINCGGGAVADYEADRVSSGGARPAPIDRKMPVEDFYIDFARANFGDAVAVPAGKLMANVDGRNMPEVTGWHDGPGSLWPWNEPWSAVKPRFDFVEKLAALRPQITGAGNLERFDYWLNTYRATAAMGEASCVRGQLDRAMNEKKYEEALAARIELARIWDRLITLQTIIVSTPGELGTIANLEQHSRRKMNWLNAHDAALEKALGKPLPAEAQPGKDYTGPSKIIVPTVRGLLRQGEALKLTVIILDKELPKNASLHFRVMAHGDWQEFPLTHVGRAVHSVSLPGVQESIEYYITAETVTGEKLIWPATAPEMNQTVVVAE